MRYKSLIERAEALIAIAHPDVRAELREAARKITQSLISSVFFVNLQQRGLLVFGTELPVHTFTIRK